MAQKTKPAAFCRPAGDSAPKPRTQGEAARHIRAIHTIKSRLKMGDDDYRALLQGLTGKRSSKDCSLTQLRAVRKHLQGLAERYGVDRAPLRSGMTQAEFEKSYLDASEPERKIWAMWNALVRAGHIQDKRPQALHAWVKRQTRVERLEWCNAAQLETLIESLKQWLRGHGLTDSKGDPT